MHVSVLYMPEVSLYLYLLIYIIALEAVQVQSYAWRISRCQWCNRLQPSPPLGNQPRLVRASTLHPSSVAQRNPATLKTHETQR